MRRHLKRLNAPKTWNIQRKGIKFTIRGNPGGMAKALTMPIATILKDDLKTVATTTEVRALIVAGAVLINHKPVKSYRSPVCFTDVISFPALDTHYRMIIDTDGKLKTLPIPKTEADILITKIINKTLIKGKVQFNLMGGINIFFEKPHYKVGDSLKVTIKEHIVKEHLALEQGATVLLYSGKHIGKIGVLQKMEKNTVFIKVDNTVFETNKDYVLVLGKDKVDIKMSK